MQDNKENEDGYNMLAVMGGEDFTLQQTVEVGGEEIAETLELGPLHLPAQAEPDLRKYMCPIQPNPSGEIYSFTLKKTSKKMGEIKIFIPIFPPLILR